jgi:hypothetical protein
MSAESGNGRSNWTLIISAVSMSGVFVAGAWVIIGLKIENSVSDATADMSRQLAELKAQQIAHNDLLRAKLIEIETQFRAEDQLRNIQWADQRRTLTMLWEKTFNSRYPSEVQFYPSISQPPDTSK